MASSESSMWTHFLKLPKPSSSKYHPAVCNYCQDMLACSNENRLTEHILFKCEKAPVSAKVKRPTSGSYAEEGAASASGRKSAQPPLRSVSLGTETPPAATSSTPVASHGSQLQHEAINVVSPPWTHDTDDEDYDIESDISGE